MGWSRMGIAAKKKKSISEMIKVNLDKSLRIIEIVAKRIKESIVIGEGKRERDKKVKS